MPGLRIAHRKSQYGRRDGARRLHAMREVDESWRDGRTAAASRQPHGARCKGIALALSERATQRGWPSARVRCQAAAPIRRQGVRSKRTAAEGEALGQQRGDFVDVHGDVGACGDGVVTSHGATGQDGEYGRKQARNKRAAAAVGEGDVMRDVRRMSSIPPYQRATDSHDYTRLVTLKVLNTPAHRTHPAFNKSGRRSGGKIVNVLHISDTVRNAPQHDDDVMPTCGSAYTSQKRRQIFFKNTKHRVLDGGGHKSCVSECAPQRALFRSSCRVFPDRKRLKVIRIFDTRAMQSSVVDAHQSCRIPHRCPMKSPPVCVTCA